MARPAYTWLITDTHFYHKRMVEICGRPEDFTERILTNCRHLIAPQDELIHLGDVAFYRMGELKGMLDSIPCRSKVLVMGNHDKESRGWYGRNGFNFVCDSLTIGDVLFSHKPIYPLPAGIRLLIHGHWHKLGDRVREFPAEYDPVKYRLVALEYTDYKPVRFINGDICKKK